MPFVLPVVIAFGTLFYILYREMPVYRQTRTGMGNRDSNVWKLRSMRDIRNEHLVPLPDSSRLTRLGRFMRANSIDELPQFLNIIKGEMSLVGPRPQISEYLPAMTERERQRHAVLPGLTGYAQINGRNAVTWTERFAQDLWYVENASFWLDVRILLKTPFAVMSGRNTAHEGHTTMPNLLEERRTPVVSPIRKEVA